MDFNKYVKGDALNLGSIIIDISELVGFLRSNTYIKKLFLDGLYANDENAEALAKINLTNLTSIHLKGSGIRNLVAKALSQALKSNLPNLTSFYLRKDYITQYDAGVLSKALKSSELPNLTSLHFKGRKIDRFGIKALRQALETGNFPNLTSLRFGGDENVVSTLKRKFSSEPEVSTASSTKSLIPHPKKFKSDEANNQASQQQGAQTQFDQQQKPNAQNTQQQAQATSDSTVPPMSRGRSLSLSSPGGSNNDQPGPSSELDEVPLISRSQSLNSLHSDDSGTKIDGSSQCR